MADTLSTIDQTIIRMILSFPTFEIFKQLKVENNTMTHLQ